MKRLRASAGQCRAIQTDSRSAPDNRSEIDRPRSAAPDAGGCWRCLCFSPHSQGEFRFGALSVVLARSHLSVPPAVAGGSVFAPARSRLSVPPAVAGGFVLAPARLL